MKTFKDNSGRTWTIAINVDAIKRVRSLLDIDLLAIVEGKLLEQLVGDPVLLCDLVYCLCKPEADAQAISDEEFGRAMAGDAIDQATTALLEELVDFFPQAKRHVLQKVLAKLKNVEARALDAAETKLSQLDEQIDREIESHFAQLMSGSSSGSLPASSE